MFNRARAGGGGEGEEGGGMLRSSRRAEGCVASGRGHAPSVPSATPPHAVLSGQRVSGFAHTHPAQVSRNPSIHHPILSSWASRDEPLCAPQRPTFAPPHPPHPFRFAPSPRRTFSPFGTITSRPARRGGRRWCPRASRTPTHAPRACPSRSPSPGRHPRRRAAHRRLAWGKSPIRNLP